MFGDNRYIVPEKNYPQLWERNSDNKRCWIMEDGKVEEIENIGDKEDEHFLYGF